MGAYAIVIFVMVMIYTLYMGFNDGSTAIATTIVSRAMPMKSAIVIAALTKFLVPILSFLIAAEALSVAANINTSLVAAEAFGGLSDRQAFAYIFSAMFGSMLWGLIAFVLKIPNTISHTLLGGLIGAAMTAFGADSVLWTDYVLLNVVAMVLLAPIIGFILGYILMRLIKKIAIHATKSVSKVLVVLQRLNLIVLSGAFASNNSQKALGVVLLLGTLGLANYSTDNMPVWIVIAIAAAMTVGMLFGGLRVINTVGRKIYKVGPIHSVVAQLTTSAVSLVGTGLGISLGMGQVMTASVMGVGAAERMRAVNWATSGKIILGWCMTLPISGGCSALMYIIVKAIMGI